MNKSWINANSSMNPPWVKEPIHRNPSERTQYLNSGTLFEADWRINSRNCKPWDRLAASGQSLVVASGPCLTDTDSSSADSGVHSTQLSMSEGSYQEDRLMDDSMSSATNCTQVKPIKQQAMPRSAFSSYPEFQSDFISSSQSLFQLESNKMKKLQKYRNQNNAFHPQVRNTEKRLTNAQQHPEYLSYSCTDFRSNYEQDSLLCLQDSSISLCDSRDSPNNFVRRHSNCDDPGPFLDQSYEIGIRNRTANLSAHQMSLSEPATQVSSASSKKSSKIVKQLKTITENLNPTVKANVLQSRKMRKSFSSDSNDDDFGFRGKQSQQTTPRSGPLEHHPVNGSKENCKKNGASRSRSKLNRFRERKSAPCTPEMLRKNKMGDVDGQGISNKEHITVRTPTSMLQLTEAENMALHKVAIEKLETFNLGCPIIIPKDNSNSRKSLMDLFQRLKNVNMDQRNVDQQVKGCKSLTFGIPLMKCISNDRSVAVRRRSPSNLQQSRVRNSQLLDALSLSYYDAQGRCRSPSAVEELLSPEGQVLQVPYVVKACCSHLRSNGLRLTGLFRVGGSRSRVAALKSDFDQGLDVHLSDDQNPHDVASLLKEYFRDLPEPLLSKELYPAFLATADIKERNDRLEALRMLVALLPACNRETLWTLLSFLHIVAQNCNDQSDKNGLLVPGNKMNASNLAKVFGPNILRKSRTGKFQVDGAEQLNRCADVATVVQDLIESHEDIFKLTKDLHAEMIDILIDEDPDSADYLLGPVNDFTDSSQISSNTVSGNPAQDPFSLNNSSDLSSMRGHDVSSSATSPMYPDHGRTRSVRPADTYACTPQQHLKVYQTSHLSNSSSSSHFTDRKIDRTSIPITESRLNSSMTQVELQSGFGQSSPSDRREYNRGANGMNGHADRSLFTGCSEDCSRYRSIGCSPQNCNDANNRSMTSSPHACTISPGNQNIPRTMPSPVAGNKSAGSIGRKLLKSGVTKRKNSKPWSDPI